jgi:CheY-like chemotaxis protein
VFALCADLMFASRIRAAAGSRGAVVQIFPSVERLLAALAESPPHRLLVDLELRSGDPVRLIAGVKSDGRTRDIEIVAWVSHVREDLIAAARAAGADRVLARSAFVRQLDALFGGEEDEAPGRR